MPASSGEAASLVESAMLLRWRAPELALLLADRAVAAAGDDRTTVLRADHLAAFALNRLGWHAGAAGRLVPALQDPDTPADLRHELQVELAYSAAALGEPATALAALRPVLAVGEDIGPVLRGTALVVAAESSGMLGRGEVVAATLEEADELFADDPYLDRDTALLLRATAGVVHAAHRRRNGASAQAETLARAGCELLTGLGDPEHDSGQVGGRLMLELVLALLDRGEVEAAIREAQPVLRRPVRAAAASAVGWLRLALATRAHLAEARHEPALTLLADAVEMTQRHGMYGVLAECLEGLSHVHEMRGEFADALHCVRSARAAESRHRRMVETARSVLLEHCGPARREVPGLLDQITALLPDTAGLRATGDPDPEEPLLPDAGQVPPGPEEPPADEAESRVEPDEPAVPEPVILGRVRPTLGARGSTNGVPPWELADASVLVNPVHEHPGTPEVAAEAAPEPAVVQVGPGPVTETAAEAVAEPAGGTAVEPANAHQTAEQPVPLPEVPPTAEADGQPWLAADEDAPETRPEPPPAPGSRRRRGAGGTPVLVSDLLPPSVLSAGRSGRRRAEDRPEEREETPAAETGPAGGRAEYRPETVGDSQPDDHQDSPAGADPQTDPTVSLAPYASSPSNPTAEPAEEPVGEPENTVGLETRLNGLAALETQLNGAPVLETELNGTPAGQDTGRTRPSLEFPVSGPPPAPPPRVLEWVTNDSGSAAVSPEVSMGELLAGALAAFQESGHPLAQGIDMTGPMTLDLVAGRDAANQHGAHPRRAPGRQLTANPGDREADDVAEALTDPELRLPDLTAEPRWRPPGTGHRSAAGE